MRNSIAAILISAAWAAATTAGAAELQLKAEDTVQSVLAGQKGTRITVRLRSGQEFNGIVREVNSRVVQIGALGGKEFFDAIIPLDAVEAVFFRTAKQ